MFNNQEFSNHELNDEQLDSVDGGYWGYYNYDSYASPYAHLNSYNWGSTQALLSSAAAGFAARNAQHDAFMRTF